MEIGEKFSELVRKKRKLENRLKTLLQQKSFEAEYENLDGILQIDIQIAALHKQIEKTSINLLNLEYLMKETDLHNKLKISRQTISQNFNNIKATLKKNLNYSTNFNDLVAANETIQPNKLKLPFKSSENSPAILPRSPTNNQKHSFESKLKILNYKIPINKIILDSEKSLSNSPKTHKPVLPQYAIKLQKLKKEENIEIDSMLKHINKEKKQLGEILQKQIFEKKKRFLNERKIYLGKNIQSNSGSLTKSRPNSQTGNRGVIKRVNRTPIIFRNSLNDY